MFKRLGIKIEEVNMTRTEAVEKLKDGELAATVLVAGKPAQSMTRLKQADGLSFLAIPYTKELGANYLPSTLTHDDYPEMIPAGQSVDTIADEAVLIAYNWPKGTDRYQQVRAILSTHYFQGSANSRSHRATSNGARCSLNSNLAGWARYSSLRRPGSITIALRRRMPNSAPSSTRFQILKATRDMQRRHLKRTSAYSRNFCAGTARGKLTRTRRI